MYIFRNFKLASTPSKHLWLNNFLKPRFKHPYYIINKSLLSLTIGIRPSIRHGQDSRASVLLGKVLIDEFADIVRFPTRAIATGKITALAHKPWNHSVELGVLEKQGLSGLPTAFLARTQGSKILSHFRSTVHVQFHHDLTSWTVTNLNFEEHPRICHVHESLQSQRNLYFSMNYVCKTFEDSWCCSCMQLHAAHALLFLGSTI